MILLELFRLNERHENIVDALRPFSQMDDVFVSFRDLPKLGINPQSSYDTPIGIYAYPIVEMWGHIERNTLPFAGDQKYVVVFNAHGNVPDLDEAAPSGYSMDMYKRDIKKIKQMYFGPISVIYRKAMDKQQKEREERCEDRIFVILSDTIRPRPTTYVIDKNVKRIMAGWLSGVVEDYEQITPDIAAKIEELLRICKAGSTIHVDTMEDMFNQELEFAAQGAKHKTPAGCLWNVTRLLAKKLSSNRSQILWASILRKLGYDGFTDRNGTGLIHSNEPCQSCFLFGQGHSVDGNSAEYP